MAKSSILLLCCLVKVSALSAARNSMTADFACWSTCMALTAPQEADMEDRRSKVTLLGRFWTSTRSVVQGGGAGPWPWGVMVMEVREGEGLCRMGAEWRGVRWGREGRGALCRGGGCPPL